MSSAHFIREIEDYFHRLTGSTEVLPIALNNIEKVDAYFQQEQTGQVASSLYKAQHFS